MSDMEKEFKWNASPRGAFERFLAALRQTAGPLPAPRKLSITDRYLDNERGEFAAQKIALRIRRTGNDFEATLKTRTVLQKGLARRQEFTLRLVPACSFAAALKKLQTYGKWEGFALKDLTVRFALRNQRQTYLVRYKRAVCEVALDAYVIFAGARRLRGREIELELKSGPEADFLKLIRKINLCSLLQPAKISKVASAEKLLNG